MIDFSSTRSVVDALATVRNIVSAPGCGAPSTLLRLLGERAGDLSEAHLYSGLLLDYPFLDAVSEGRLAYSTWHVMPAIRRLVQSGVVPFHPLRASQVTGLLDSLPVHAALVRVSPPNRHGFCSLGPSVSYPIHAVRTADLVIAEIDPDVPNTRGDSEIHVSEIDIAIESDTPMAEYRRAPVDDASRQIAAHLIALLPESPTLQVGIGAIPEAFVDELLHHKIGGLRFAGMATDGMADLFEAGLLDTHTATPYPAITAAELMGTRTLMDFAHENAAIAAFSNRTSITASSLWNMERFVTINSAIEVDAHGQVGSEVVAGEQISGVGGSVDFTESAIHSAGGVRVIAMKSMNVRDATSKIVNSFAAGTSVTVPRHSVDIVVTEYGAVSLAYASTARRKELLASIAHPDHRESVIG